MSASRLAITAALLLATATAFKNEIGTSEAGVPLSVAFREGLKEQALRELESRGESITIMAIGESGLGKTSLLSSLFHTELVWPDAATSSTTVDLR